MELFYDTENNALITENELKTEFKKLTAKGATACETFSDYIAATTDKNGTLVNCDCLKKLYDYIAIDCDSAPHDMKNGYLTVNDSNESETYFYYYDGVNEAAIKINTREIVSDSERLSELF